MQSGIILKFALKFKNCADGKCKISHGRQRSNKTKYMYISEENLKKHMNNLEQVFYFLRNYISK